MHVMLLSRSFILACLKCVRSKMMSLAGLYFTWDFIWGCAEIYPMACKNNSSSGSLQLDRPSGVSLWAVKRTRNCGLLMLKAWQCSGLKVRIVPLQPKKMCNWKTAGSVKMKCGEKLPKQWTSCPSSFILFNLWIAGADCMFLRYLICHG